MNQNMDRVDLRGAYDCPTPSPVVPFLWIVVLSVLCASSGIGRAVSVFFAHQGSRIALLGRNEEKLQLTHSLCKSASNSHSGADFLLINMDLSQTDQLPGVMEKVLNHFGKLDVLINNAGILVEDDIATFKVENFMKLVNTNLLPAIRLTQLATPKLAESKGCVINVSAVLSQVPKPHMMSYSALKAALDMITKCSAQELGPLGIRVNGVAPGLTATDLLINAGVAEKTQKQKFMWARGGYPLKRAGTPEDIAQVIAFLASPQEAAFVTGTTLAVDGGMLVM
ncbi:hypothetical protein Aperf_G00000128302 [Anoplocephala perfoliata]